MKIAKIVLSTLLIVAMLAGCVPATQTQPGTTQNMQQPTTTQQTQPTQTQPAPTTQPQQTEPAPTTQPPATEPPATEPPATEPPATEPPATEPPVYELAANFTVYDAEGNEVELSDFIGKPIILNFWASWCPPCLAELVYFERKYQEYGDQVQFLMVNLTSNDTREEADDLITRRGYTFPVFYDNQSSAVRAYKISSIPVTYVINEEGYIIASAVGSIKSADLQAFIDKLLGNA